MGIFLSVWRSRPKGLTIFEEDAQSAVGLVSYGNASLDSVKETHEGSGIRGGVAPIMMKRLRNSASVGTRKRPRLARRCGRFVVS